MEDTTAVDAFVAADKRVRQLSDQVTELKRCAQLVRILHQSELVEGVAVCATCRTLAPCATARALKGRR